MTDAEREVERGLTEAGLQFINQYISTLELLGTRYSAETLEVLRAYGPLIYKAGAAHVFQSFDCYPKTT